MQYDVIVVGGGGSGLATAVSALQEGARVLVLEKNEQLGGTTGIAIGSFTTAETRFQRSAGVSDSVRDHIEDAGKFAPPEIEARNNDELRAFFLENSADTLTWMESLGVQFVGPHPEPPNRQPRMHNATAGAKAYIAAMQLEVQRHGGDIICAARVRELIRDAGRVAGVCYWNGTVETRVSSHTVVLAGGDYSSNPELIARYKGDQYREIEGINPFADGSSHDLAEQVGAKLLNMDITYGPELRFVAGASKPFQQWLPATGRGARLVGFLAQRAPRWLVKKMIKRLLVTWQHPEDALFDDGAILLNKRARRFVDETKWPDREIATAEQEDKTGFIYLDKALVERYSQWPHFISTAPDIAYAYARDYLRLRPDVAVRGDLAKLAAARELPIDELKKTIQSQRGGAEFDANDGMLLGPVKAYFTTTEGGAAVNRRLQVLDDCGEPIRGLYAAGQTGSGGMVLFGHGLHIAWALTSGRLAGKQAAAEATDPTAGR
ncbi:MAG: FAD-dependent oxidoreductase [Pirellulaceae bacterium]|nr:FAD-dependent oxidoreductase [Pirellulaceae bacterium]